MSIAPSTPITPMVILLFGGSMVLQVSSMIILPLTNGFMCPAYTLARVVALSAGTGLLARIVKMGFPLDILVSFAAAILPFTVSIVAFALYKEPMSPIRAGALIDAAASVH